MRYFVGVDIGTDSVGWAVTDEVYRLIRRRGELLWGVRLFEEAQKAEERRGKRIARRRIERRHQRLSWLQDVFAEPIAAIDPAFFQRLRESKFLEQDKRDADGAKLPGRYTLFCDKDYNDVAYHREFPTIWHLRHALMTQDRAFDVRLLYLAVHHILKNRGHFLFEEMNLDAQGFESSLKELDEAAYSLWDEGLTIADPAAFRAAMITDAGVKRKQRALEEAAGVDAKADPMKSKLLNLLAGGKVAPNALFGTEDEDDEREKGFRLGDELEAIAGALAEEEMRFVVTAKKLYDRSRLETMLAGADSLSAAKVRIYERHREDLRRLKALCRSLGKETCHRMFRDSGPDNYVAYSGHGVAKCCDAEAFAKGARKILEQGLKGHSDPALQAEVKQIADELAGGRFLPKQTGKDNGVVPHQLHEKELSIILRRAARHLPFLNETDASGLPLQERILQMFRFRIPYYVGPLSKSPGENHWIVRTDEKITPWNFERVVDLAASAERFIRRMTAKCSYIGEDVLPKDSLLYTRFMVLNAINKLKVNGEAISVEVKQRLYQEVFLKHRRVTKKRIADWLLAEGLIARGDTLSGVDATVNASLLPWIIFARQLKTPQDEARLEDIIRHIALFGEDRKLLERWLKTTYGDVMSPEDQRYALAQRTTFGGWGRLSEAFLTKITHVDPETGEVMSILDALWQTNDNLMELLSAKYRFIEEVEAYRRQKLVGNEKLDALLDESYAAPGVRRAIRQTLSILSEVEKAMGCPPARVFVEMTRGEGKKERTVSRKDALLRLYEACRKEEPALYEELQGRTEGELRRDKLYLYYTQLGKCLYSGETIDLASLDALYDIDHIWPQSKIKDDSLENRVLVKKTINAGKQDVYPINGEIRAKMGGFWRMLRTKGLIGEKKYARLTRNEAFTESELSDFIARQLVETSQASKLVAELLRRRWAQTEVVYVKAGNVSSFRQDQRLLPDGTRRQAWACRNQQSRQDPLFVKCREVNDLHHAKDAYLNIVVGNVYHVKFTRDPRNFFREKKPYSLNRMFDFDVRRGDEMAWRSGEDGSIAVVRRTMGRNSARLTRMPQERTGEFFKQQIVAKGEGQVPIKTSDPRMTIEKFGGYNKRTGTFFCLVEHEDKKKKRVRSIETVYLMDKSWYERDPEGYCRDRLGLHAPRILIPKIRFHEFFRLDGALIHITGRTGDSLLFGNATPLVLSAAWMHYVKTMSKYVERCQALKIQMDPTSYDGVTAQQNAELYQVLIQKLQLNCYRVLFPSTVVKTLVAKTEAFRALHPAIQCRLLLNLMRMFSGGTSGADLSALNEGKQSGRIIIGSAVSDKRKISLVRMSPTGLYTEEIDLRTVGAP